MNERYEPLGLNLHAANMFIEQRIDQAQKYLEDLSNILASGYVSDESIFKLHANPCIYR